MRNDHGTVADLDGVSLPAHAHLAWNRVSLQRPGLFDTGRVLRLNLQIDVRAPPAHFRDPTLDLNRLLLIEVRTRMVCVRCQARKHHQADTDTQRSHGVSPLLIKQGR